MRIFDIAVKDLKQITRDKRAFLFLLLMPITFTFFFGWVYGSFTDVDEDFRIPVGWSSEDSSNMLSDELLALLESSEAIRPLIFSGENVDELALKVIEGDLAAAVHVPTGFNLDMETRMGPKITILADRLTPAGQTATDAIQVGIARLLGAVKTAEISTSVFEELEGFENQREAGEYFGSSLNSALEGWEHPPLGLRIVQLSGDQNETDFNPYAQASPGMLIQFTVFGLINSATLIVIERKTGTLARLMTTPISRAEMIAGHILAMFIVVLVQQMLLIILGQFLGLDYFKEPIALLILVLSFTLFATSYGLLIGVLAKTEDQVVMMAMLSMFLLSGLGGAWFPLEFTGDAFSAIGHLTPTAWAMDGFQNLILRGLGLQSVLLSVGINLTYASLCFGLSVWKFRFE